MQAQIEKRKTRIESEIEGRTVHGYAALFNSRTELAPGFFEEIRPGAFKNAIGKSDVRALFNHDSNLILARTGSGTLEIGEDNKGLWYRFEAPNTSFGNDLLEMIKRGDVSQSSFAFTVKDSEFRSGENGSTVRSIAEVDALYDVSPVTYPAYEDTTVAVRSLQEYRSKEHPPVEDDNAEDDILKKKMRLIQMRMAEINQ